MSEYYIQDISENLSDSQYSSLCEMYQEYMCKQLMEELNLENNSYYDIDILSYNLIILSM